MAKRNSNPNTATENMTEAQKAASELAAKLQKAEQEYLLHCELNKIEPQDSRFLLLNPTTAALFAESSSFLTAAQRESIAGEWERRASVKATIDLLGAARYGENLNAELAAAAKAIKGSEQVPNRQRTIAVPVLAVVANAVVFGECVEMTSTKGRTGGMVAYIRRDGASEGEPLVAVDARDRRVGSFRVATVADVREHTPAPKRTHRQSANANAAE